MQAVAILSCELASSSSEARSASDRGHGREAKLTAEKAVLMNLHVLKFPLALAFLAGGVAHALQGTVQVTLTELPLLPGGMYTSAFAINDDGVILGLAMDATGNVKPVKWVNGQISVLTSFGSSILPVPADVNDAGQGVATDTVGLGEGGLYWDPAGNPFALPPLPGAASSTRANAINSNGWMVGRASDGSPNSLFHAVIWVGNTLQTDLGFMGGGSHSEALGINDLGVVVGEATVANSNLHAFSWQNGQFTDLGTWPGAGATSSAYAINHQGDVVGINANVASIWKNGTVTPLPMPPGVSPFTPAVDINDAGDIIATGPLFFPDEVGVLWFNGTPIRLGGLPGSNYSRARRINQRGDVVGESQEPGGYFRAVLWRLSTPTTPFCAGDGSGTACPCGNVGSPGRGCAHSSNASGARLASTGLASLSRDTLELAGSGLPAGPALYFQGTSGFNGGLGGAFGDGLRCAGGVVTRLGVQTTTIGTSRYPAGADPAVSVKGFVTAPGTRTYQVWYRDSAPSFCTAATFNLTNGLSVSWSL